MALVEAAGFDVVIVETVGVGQSEVAVAGMVDFFLVLLLAGGGDDLQGIKRGIIEIADMIAITKADGDNIARARRAQAVYQGALAISTPTSPNWATPVLTVSRPGEPGLDELWEKDRRAPRRGMTESGELPGAAREPRPWRGWRSCCSERLLAALEADADVAAAAGRARGRGAGRRAHAGACGRRAVGDDGARA